MNNELKHHGVIGMKWGVRRSKAQLAKSQKQKSSDSSDQKAPVKEKLKATAKRGAKATAKVVKKVGKAYLTDQLLFGGRGTKAAKTAIKYTGRAAVTAYTISKGGYDIRWYDN